MRTRIRKIATGLPLMLLLSACGQFQSEAEAASMAVVSDGDDTIAQTEGMAPNDAVQPVWGRLAETDPGLGEAYEVVVASWDSNESKEMWQLLARIEADGSFRLLDSDDTPMTADNTSSVTDSFYCSSGGLDVDGGGVRLRELHLEVRRVSDRRKYGLVATNSQAYADWLGGSREPFQPGTIVISVYKSSGEARVRGTCTAMNEEYGTRVLTHHDLDLKPGVNFVSDHYDVFVPGENAQVDGWFAGNDSENILKSTQALPDDVRWHLYEPHVPVASDSIIWGQLDGGGLESTALRIHANEPLDGGQLGPDVPVGETGPDGYFHFSDPALPQAMLDAASPVGELFCENAEIDNPDARMIGFNLGATDADGGRWILSGAARREHASLRAGRGGKFQQGAQELRVYYLSERVQIEDDCGGNRSSFHFSPGWNLVRATVVEMDGHDDENGPWPTRWSQESLPEVPSDMRWYLFPAFPRMDGQGQH